MTVGTQGRRRNIDPDTAIRIGIFAELFRFGIPAVEAAIFADLDLNPHAKLLVVRRPNDEALRDAAYASLAVTLESYDQISEWVRSRFPDRPPTILAVINIEVLAERMRRAEEEQWSQEGKADG